MGTPQGVSTIADKVNADKIEMGMCTVEIDGTEYAARSASISHEIDYHTPDIPGVLGPVEGLSYLTQFVPQLEVELLDYEGSPFEDDDGYGLPLVGDVTITGYKLRSGDPYTTTIKRGMVTDFGREYGGDGKEATTSMTIVGTYGVDEDGHVETGRPIKFGDDNGGT